MAIIEVISKGFLRSASGFIFLCRPNIFCASVRLTSYDYKVSISEDIENADLVISHAGAGTCIEVLNAKKPLIAVVNESLMNNHQSELANQLTSDGHCLNCIPETLERTFIYLDESKLKPLPPAKPEFFVNYLDRFFGFA